MENRKFRLVTRSDMDGLVCAVLFRKMDMIDEILFVHPKDMQDGKIEITDRDITTNLPYVEGVHLAFDHHQSEIIRNEPKSNYIIDPKAPSASRVVYEYYGGRKRFPDISIEMMEAVDKADSAQFTRDEILNPKGWVLLNFIMDPRTGLGRFKEFRISNYELMMKLIDYCKDHSINQILKLPDVRERIELLERYEYEFREQLVRCSRLYDNIIVFDLRGEEIIYPGNRFMIYAIFPEQNISIHVLWGLKRVNTVLAVGKSIINRDSKANIGALMLKYGGGGHPAAGTCQIVHEKVDKVLDEIIESLRFS
jgi:nanoRNase/pAp phosphatase (c-di-AMP/oligoRNAs hydrolase)